MLVSHAHSYRQQSRLAVTLAWVAGYTNVLTFLTCGTVTSHVSGTTSTLGRVVFSGQWEVAGFVAFLLVCFFTGAGISGFCTELGRRRAWESIFVLPITIETGLLAALAVLLLYFGPPASQTAPLEFAIVGLAASAMGLQNATITQISRGQVRTTHVTGVLTDLGQEMVQFCWWSLDHARIASTGKARATHTDGEQPMGRRLLLLAAIYFMFAVGSGLGTVMYAWLPSCAMFPPVMFLLWIVYQDLTTPIAEIEASHASFIGADLPSTLAVYHLRRDRGADGKGRVFRIPNLLAWSGRLPEETRAVILDVGGIPEFNSNALLELKALLGRFRATGRSLIISGLHPRYMEQMMVDGEQEWLVEHVCPDLDLAVARALNFLNQVQ